MGWANPVIEGLLQLTPLFAFCLVWPGRARPAFGLFCLLFLLDKVLTTSLSGITLLPGGRWNWAGKVASLSWGVAFIGSNPWLTKQEMGWTCRLEAGSRRLVGLLVFLVLSIRLSLDLVFRGIPAGYDAETFWFQATMPGLSEEVAFRGIFLPLLRRAVPGRVLRVSYGLLLSSLLFGLIHGLRFDGQVHFSTQRLVMTTALGFVLGLVVERGGSLAPAILLHNLWNLIVFRA